MSADFGLEMPRERSKFGQTALNPRPRTPPKIQYRLHMQEIFRIAC